MPLGSRDADPARGTPTPARQAGIAGSVVTAAQLLPLVLPNGRTSTGARQATAALRPHPSASSRLAASSTQKPPMCSLVSRYGPSVIRTLPSGCTRSDLALLAAERPPTKILTPAATISSLSVDIAGHRFVLCGRVVVVGVVNSNQILRHDFSILSAPNPECVKIQSTF
jgi:hypothetical protein